VAAKLLIYTACDDELRAEVKVEYWDDVTIKMVV
jgi:hypothetical protein